MLAVLPPPSIHFSIEAAYCPALRPVVDDLRQLAQNHALYGGKIPVVGIGGCPGVGKTYVTEILKKDLELRGVSCLVIHFDDWTNPPEKMHEHYFNLNGIHHFFAQMASGQQVISKPVVNEFTDARSEETVDLTHVDLILFEGLATITPLDEFNFAQYSERHILVDAPWESITEWKRARPCTTSRTEEEFAAHMGLIKMFYDAYITPFRNQAHWIIEKDANHGYHLQ